jgi:hypothetical protein
MTETVEIATPIAITHLLPNVLLNLKPNLIVNPAQSIANGAPIGV